VSGLVKRCPLFEIILHGKQHAVGQIAVVRNGDYLAAGFVLVGLQPFPQFTWIRAAHRWRHGERFHLQGALWSVAEDHIAVPLPEWHRKTTGR